jgi:hypothetical protein
MASMPHRPAKTNDPTGEPPQGPHPAVDTLPRRPDLIVLGGRRYQCDYTAACHGKTIDVLCDLIGAGGAFGGCVVRDLTTGRARLVGGPQRGNRRDEQAAVEAAFGVDPSPAAQLPPQVDRSRLRIDRDHRVYLDGREIGSVIPAAMFGGPPKRWVWVVHVDGRVNGRRCNSRGYRTQIDAAHELVRTLGPGAHDTAAAS